LLLPLATAVAVPLLPPLQVTLVVLTATLKTVIVFVTEIPFAVNVTG
jgi:hypothetical protein